MTQRWRPRPGDTAETFVERVIDTAQAAEVARLSASLRENGHAEPEIHEALRELRAWHQMRKGDALAELDELGPLPVKIAH